MNEQDGYLPTADGLRLYYRVFGEGELTTLIVPGACLLADDILPLTEGRRVITYDMRGRGGSDPDPDPAHLWREYETQDLETVRQFFALERFSLLGWSYMGGAAAVYATEHPERVERLVLAAAIPPRFPAPYDNPEEEARKATERIDLNEIEALKTLQAAGLDQARPDEYCRQVNAALWPRQMGRPEALQTMRSDPCHYENEWLSNLAEHKRIHFPPESWKRDWRQRAKRIRAATLVVHGTEDLIPLAAAGEWAAFIPDARLLVLEGAGHILHLEAPEPFFLAVDWFLWGGWPDDALVVTPPE